MTPTKGKTKPMGVSAWMAHGKKYGYDKFWLEKERDYGEALAVIGLIAGIVALAIWVHWAFGLLIMFVKYESKD